jgi:hypothetical protein
MEAPLPPKPPIRTHCACGEKLPESNTKEISRSMYYVPRYSCSNRCHNDSILGIGAFKRDRGPVGEGWMPIILDLNEKLTKLDPEYRIMQIKEKFGTLRYYFDRSGTTDTRPRVRLTWKELGALHSLARDTQRHLDGNIEGSEEPYELDDYKWRRNNIEAALKLYKRAQDKMDAAERAAENLSAITCEICGKPGKLDNSQHYVITLCEDHIKSRAESGKAIWQMEDDHRELNKTGE